MSLIHLEKSVLTFHLKEILEDGHGNHPLTWLSLGLLLLAPTLFAPLTKTSTASRRTLHDTARSGHLHMPLSQWVTEIQSQQMNATESSSRNSLVPYSVYPMASHPVSLHNLPA
ncbi:hypothetical protein ACN4EG_17970 [Alkalinema pantanalense CENA528]